MLAIYNSQEIAEVLVRCEAAGRSCDVLSDEVLSKQWGSACRGRVPPRFAPYLGAKH